MIAKQVQCSFCFKDNSTLPNHFVKGRKGVICSECIIKCKDVLEDRSNCTVIVEGNVLYI